MLTKIININNNVGGGQQVSNSKVPKQGDRHYREYLQMTEQTNNQLQRSARSYSKELSIHRDKIVNPALHDKDWNTRNDKAKAGLQSYWSKEIESLQMKLDWANGILQERGL